MSSCRIKQNNMRGLWPLLLVCVSVSGQTPLKCRRCIGAASLEDCTLTVPCPTGEVCYMDEMVTEQLTIEYNGGCRPRDVCSRGAIGKRDGALVACTECCSTSTDCNTKLCAIKSSLTSPDQCYQCAGGSGVTDPNACTSAHLVSCAADQGCGAETHRLSTHEIYEFKCMPTHLCSLLTVQALKSMEACRHGTDPSCFVGKRQAGVKTCTACCGDNQCNSGSCTKILNRLYNLWQLGVFDLHTLKTNATLPTTPASG